MKKTLLLLSTLPLFSFGQVGIEPFDPGTPGTFLGDFSTLFTTGDIAPDVSAYTEEGDIGGTDDFTVDDGSGFTLFTGGTGDFCAIIQDPGLTRTLVSPEMDFGATTGSPTMTFRYIIDDGTSASAPGWFELSEIEVVWKESAAGPWNVAGTFTTVDNTWHDETVDLSGAASYSTFYIGIRVSTPNTGTMFPKGLCAFDEIEVTASSCSASSNSIDVTECISYTVPSGDETHIASGTVMDTIPNAAGCDSVITINLTIVSPDITITQSGGTLNAVGGATYQWINCTDSSIIAGATSSSFTPTVDGDYAVIIDIGGGCSDTSACTSVTGVGIESFSLSDIRVYPNPVSEELIIELPEGLIGESVEILSIDGRIIRDIQNSSAHTTVDFSSFPNGTYILRLHSNEYGVTHERILKQ